MPSHEKITMHMALLACEFVMCMTDIQSITFFDSVPFQYASVPYTSAVLQ